MKTLVGELERSKQEMQRLVHRPKATIDVQTDPVENESIPIIKEQKSMMREYESQIRNQENEIGIHREEIEILISSKDSSATC